MTHTWEQRVLALAGVFQAAALVRTTATQGAPRGGAVDTCLASIFTLDADSVEAVYGERPQLGEGLSALRRQLAPRSGEQRDVEVMRYALSLLTLERKVVAREATLTGLREGIEAAGEAVRHFGLTHENTVARLGELYQQTISQVAPRIMVRGDPDVLSNPHHAALIRALLLAGIRSAVLWRQIGGSRWQMVLSRGRIATTAERLAGDQSLP